MFNLQPLRHISTLPKATELLRCPEMSRRASVGHGNLCKTFGSSHIHGPHVPVEEPSTASEAEVGSLGVGDLIKGSTGLGFSWPITLECRASSRSRGC
jgi:hypothetical protein